MLRKSEEKHAVQKPGPFNGKGEIIVQDILNGPDEMYRKGRVFCHTTVLPGSSVGYHTHNGDAETYYVISGHGTFNDNGELKKVGPGDVLYTGDGEGHSLEATEGEPVDVIALILYH